MTTKRTDFECSARNTRIHLSFALSTSYCPQPGRVRSAQVHLRTHKKKIWQLFRAEHVDMVRGRRAVAL